MTKLLLFAGTTEGRELASALALSPKFSVTASVATEYGASLLGDINGITILQGRLSSLEIAALITSKGFDTVVDATHPYAALITEGIARACQITGTAYLRLSRGESCTNAEADSLLSFESLEDAVAWLSSHTGNIMLTTGSKELFKYTRLPDFAQRCYPRILPSAESISGCLELGFLQGHILALQGPFSHELNFALLREYNISYLITKDSGEIGGFAQKLSAAKEWGAVLLVLRRPQKPKGFSLSQLTQILLKG